MPPAQMSPLTLTPLGRYLACSFLGTLLGLTVSGGLPFCVLVPPAIAQSTPYFPPPPPPEPQDPAENPLDNGLFPHDPLLPSSASLTPLQRRRLQENLDELDRQAQELDQAGQTDEAFTVWYRSLRGRQRLGELAEIAALGRIGQIAWEKNRKVDVGIISKRLDTLHNALTAKKAMTPELLTAFAQAYRQLHSLDSAIAVYQTIRQDAQQQKDYRRENEALSMLGELYLAKFNYPAAADAYEVLLKRAVAANNTYYEGLYLQKLGDIYQQASQPDNAIRIQEQLVDRHLQDKQIALIPELKIAIADHYLALEEAEKASQTYQEAYTLAWSIQQLSTAAIALDKLGDLYRSREQDNYALEIYKRLLRVQQQSYNYYGMMSTYEKIAQLYLDAQQPQPALTAYQQALSLARSLKHSTKENTILNQIQAVTNGSGS